LLSKSSSLRESRTTRYIKRNSARSFEKSQIEKQGKIYYFFNFLLLKHLLYF